MLCNIEYAYAVPTNAGGLIGYSLYNGQLQIPPKRSLKTWRPRPTIVSIDTIIILLYGWIYSEIC